METLRRIGQYCRGEGYELNVVGIPKTVDNDLYGTDHAPGYPSAARNVALMVRQSGRLARDMRKIDSFVVHQTVGRQSGFLAAASAFAKIGENDAPHIICLPERPIQRDRFLGDVEQWLERLGWVYVVCGEGGGLLSASVTSDSGAMGGGSAALQLHRLIHRKTGLRGEFQITESL